MTKEGRTFKRTAQHKENPVKFTKNESAFFVFLDHHHHFDHLMMTFFLPLTARRHVRTLPPLNQINSRNLEKKNEGFLTLRSSLPFSARLKQSPSLLKPSFYMYLETEYTSPFHPSILYSSYISF